MQRERECASTGETKRDRDEREAERGREEHKRLDSKRERGNESERESEERQRQKRESERKRERERFFGVIPDFSLTLDLHTPSCPSGHHVRSMLPMLPLEPFLYRAPPSTELPLASFT